MNIDGLSEATLEKFIAKGFIHEFADVFEIEKYRDEIVTMEGFGEKSFQNLLESIEKAKDTTLPKVIYSLGIANIGLANAKVICRHFDNDIENYIYEMSEKDLCLSCINKGTRFTECLLSFMNLDDSHATYIIQKIDSNYVQYIKRFEDADPFASLAYEILKGHFSYNVNEVAAYILKYVAYDINRFNAQHKIERLINKGGEPLIETILER